MKANCKYAFVEKGVTPVFLLFVEAVPIHLNVTSESPPNPLPYLTSLPSLKPLNLPAFPTCPLLQHLFNMPIQPISP